MEQTYKNGSGKQPPTFPQVQSTQNEGYVSQDYPLLGQSSSKNHTQDDPLLVPPTEEDLPEEYPPEDYPLLVPPLERQPVNYPALVQPQNNQNYAPQSHHPRFYSLQQPNTMIQQEQSNNTTVVVQVRTNKNQNNLIHNSTKI